MARETDGQKESLSSLLSGGRDRTLIMPASSSIAFSASITAAPYCSKRMYVCRAEVEAEESRAGAEAKAKAGAQD